MKLVGFVCVVVVEEKLLVCGDIALGIQTDVPFAAGNDVPNLDVRLQVTRAAV